MGMNLPQFSMRTLLAAMLALGVLMAIVARPVIELQARATRQREIIDHLEKCGASFTAYQDRPRGVYEKIRRTFDRRPFPRVSQVNLQSGGKFTASDVALLAEIEDLQGVNIFHPECDDRWLAALSRAKDLRLVSIKSDRCTAAGARALAGSPSPLQIVFLHDVRVDDEFLRRISEKPTLALLSFNADGVTAAGLGELRRAKSLMTLQIHGGQGLAEGIAQLAASPTLRIFDFIGYQWGDGDLSAVAQLKAATWLTVHSPRLPLGVMTTAESLPQLEMFQMLGDLDEAEPVQGLHFAALEHFSLHGKQKAPAGLIETLARSKQLRTLIAPGAAITQADLDLLAQVSRLEQLTVAESPSQDAIDRFRDTQPYCVYIDKKRGVFQPRIGINLARMNNSSR